MGFAVAILAAGRSARFDDGSKLRALLHGRPVIGRAVDAALASQAEQVFVVVGADPMDDLLPESVEAVSNPDWSAGQSTSLVRAIAATDRHGFDRLVVGLGDQPGLAPEAFDLVGAARGPVAIADYGSMRGHPVLLCRSVWAEVPTAGDQGARDLLAAAEAIPCPGTPDDIDTVDDLRRWT